MNGRTFSQNPRRRGKSHHQCTIVVEWTSLFNFTTIPVPYRVPVFLVLSLSPTVDGDEVFNLGLMPASGPGVELRFCLVCKCHGPRPPFPLLLIPAHFTLSGKATSTPGKVGDRMWMLDVRALVLSARVIIVPHHQTAFFS